MIWQLTFLLNITLQAGEKRLRTTQIQCIRDMSKVLVANPVAGLQGVPPRIKLDAKSLTVKTGLIGGNTTLLYSNIAEVRFQMVSSLTLSGTIIIVPYRGADIKLIGFYKKQYLIVKQAVENGYFAGGGGNDDDPEEKAVAKNAPTEYEQKQAVKTARLNSQIDSVRGIGVSSDEEGMVETLNKLLSVLDETATTKTGEESEKGELRETAKKKFDSQLQMLCMVYPENKMIPYYKAKVQEWTEAENTRKANEKKQTKWILIALACLFGAFALLIAILSIAG